MIVGAGLPSVSVHLMVMDIPTRVVTFVAGMMVREGWTGEGEGGGKEEEREGRGEGRQREEGEEGREEREVGRRVGRRVGRLGETRRECSILANEYCIKGLHKSPHSHPICTHTHTPQYKAQKPQKPQKYCPQEQAHTQTDQGG